MLNHLDPASALAFALLVFALIMVIMFEATNGFHVAANAVATVIYTKSLKPGQAILLSGALNFVGVMVGGIAVAYALVELLPAELLSPPDGAPAVKPPIWWMQGILILTCSGVSFAHGSNDGQKSISLIMLTIIGLFPATYALNPHSSTSPEELASSIQHAVPLIRAHGDDRRSEVLGRIQSLQPSQRTMLRGDVYEIISELEHVDEVKRASPDDKSHAKTLVKQLRNAVEYAPSWVRLLSAVCLGIGTTPVCR